MNPNEEQNEDIGVIKNITESEIFIEVKRKGSCINCSINSLCMGNSSQMQFRLKKPEMELSIGDEVILEIAPSDRIFSAFIIFVFPILTMVLFYALARYLLILNENPSIAFSLAGLLISGIVIKLIDKRCSERISIKILRKV